MRMIEISNFGLCIETVQYNSHSLNFRLQVAFLLDGHRRARNSEKIIGGLQSVGDMEFMRSAYQGCLAINIGITGTGDLRLGQSKQGQREAARILTSLELIS